MKQEKSLGSYNQSCFDWRIEDKGKVKKENRTGSDDASNHGCGE